jgi:hypothetical protein
MINPVIERRSKKNLRRFLRDRFQDDPIADLAGTEAVKGFAEYYLYYPYMFRNAFRRIDSEKMERLNQAGFLCFKSVIYKDNVIDKQVSEAEMEATSKKAKMMMKEAVTMLKEIFGNDAFFWTRWEERQQEFYRSVELDHQLTSSNYTYEDYIHFAWGKSAFAKLAIDALYVLEGNRSEKNYQLLLESHREFSCAMQLFDDVLDLTEDNGHVQFNIARHFTEQALAEKGIHTDGFSIEDYEKYLYVLGIAERIFNMAFEHIDKAWQIAGQLKVKPWLNVLSYYKKIYRAVGRSTHTYINKLKAELFHSQSHLLNERPLSLSPLLLQQSLAHGKQFIIGQQNEAGAWSEYLTSAGSSDVWASGLVAHYGRAFLPLPAQRAAAAFLQPVAAPLWGYMEEYINDSDSSAFALLALHEAGQDLSTYRPLLLQRQCADGGFPTYTAPEIPRLRKAMVMDKKQSYDGWTQSHPCVSSVVYHLLCNAFPEEKAAKAALEAYFLRCFREEKPLAYWWTNPAYTLFNLEQSWDSIADADLKAAIVHKAGQLAKTQSETGSFGDQFQPESAYYTGFMAGILQRLAENGHDHFRPALQKAITWLVAHQLNDGSWQPTHAMQLPSPDCIVPENTDWPVSEFGCAIRAVEYNRLYSTIISLKAIHEYYQHA